MVKLSKKSPRRIVSLDLVQAGFLHSVRVSKINQASEASLQQAITLAIKTITGGSWREVQIIVNLQLKDYIHYLRRISTKKARQLLSMRRKWKNRGQPFQGRRKSGSPNTTKSIRLSLTISSKTRKTLLNPRLHDAMLYFCSIGFWQFIEIWFE